MASVKRDTGNTCTHWVREMTRNLASAWGSGSRGKKKKKSPWKTDTIIHEQMDLDFYMFWETQEVSDQVSNRGWGGLVPGTLHKQKLV